MDCFVLFREQGEEEACVRVGILALTNGDVAVYHREGEIRGRFDEIGDILLKVGGNKKNAKLIKKKHL